MSDILHNDSFSNTQPLLSIEIQLTDTESATLIINDDDIIDNKIIQFCSEYNLPEDIRIMITDKVMSQLENQISQLEETIDDPDEDNGNGNEDTVSHNTKQIPFNKRNKGKHYPPTKGEQLYKRHIEHKDKKDALIKKLAQEKEIEELKEAVFKPTINPRSRQLVKRGPNEKIEDRLLSLGKVSKDTIAKERSKKVNEDKVKLSYRPTLPNQSKILGDIRRRIRIDEMPQSISGINPDYMTLSRTKSADVSFSTSFDNKDKERDSNDKQMNKSLDGMSTITQRDKPKTSKGVGGYSKHSNILDTESSKLSLLSMKQSSSLDKHIHNTTPYPNKSLNADKKSMIFHNKIPIPQLDPENSLHDYLYVEAKLIQTKKQKEAEEQMKVSCPFTPYIPDSVRKLVNNRQETQGQFIKRMNKTKLQNEEILINNSKLQIKNSQTERPLFRPKITRGPKDDNTRTVSVNLDSYYDKKMLQDKNETHQKEICNTLEKKKMYLERAMEIILKMKYEKYKEIFSLLDSDNDGLISSKNIKLSQLDHDVLEALTPLLDQLQVSQENMAFKDFCLKADKELAGAIFSNK